MENLSLIEQLANIGIEIYRMKRWQGVDENYFQASFNRALDLLLRTIELHKNSSYGVLKELTRLKEILIDAYLGGKEYNTDLDGLIKYFDYFINLARKNK